jgi:hypothetical protein
MNKSPVKTSALYDLIKNDYLQSVNQISNNNNNNDNDNRIESNNKENQNDSKTTLEGDNQKNNKQLGTHLFVLRFFREPILCIHCHDYIWGAGHIGFGCQNCLKCVHNKCLVFLHKSKTCDSNSASNVQLGSVLLENYPINKWSINTVKEWLAVVNLHRYSQVFSTYKIDGQQLLDLNIYQLYAFRIRDTYHHAAILQCRDELVYKSRTLSTYDQMLTEQKNGRLHLISNQYKPDKHHFLMHSLSKLTDCHLCNRPLLGIVRQALFCQKCGLLVHRQCSAIGLPNCEEVARLARPTAPIKHYIFGVSLFDCDKHSDNDGVPLLLVKAFKAIENRASLSGEDLYDVYRLSSDTNKIDKVKQQLNENGIELTRFEEYDLNTIAAIVKSFLRDLQNSALPEEIYSKLIDSVKNECPKKELQTIITNLHPQHYNTVKCIMQHLIRVWIYQYRVRGCQYLPTKLFHIFRSILLRPPWEMITQIVHNIDVQSLIIERIMLECNWDIELPDYKMRPPVPPPPSSSLSISTSLIENNSPIDSSKQEVSSMSLPLLNSQIKTIADNYSLTNNKLTDIDWYWADISRDNSNLVMKNCEDGSFLVRDSTEKSSTAPYTLCVVKGNSIKSIKIFCQEGTSPWEPTAVSLKKNQLKYTVHPKNNQIVSITNLF